MVSGSLELGVTAEVGYGDRLIRWATTLSVVVLAANVAVAEPSTVGRVIAAWPSCALIGAYELLMRQVRHAATRKTPVASQVPHTDPVAEDALSYKAGAEKAGTSQSHAGFLFGWFKACDQ
jgi:hypothetical protein